MSDDVKVNCDGYGKSNDISPGSIAFIDDLFDFVGHFIRIRLVPFDVNSLSIPFVHVRHSVLAYEIVFINTRPCRPSKCQMNTKRKFIFALGTWFGTLILCWHQTSSSNTAAFANSPIFQMWIQYGTMEFQVLRISATETKYVMRQWQSKCRTFLCIFIVPKMCVRNSSIYSRGRHLAERLIGHVASIVAPLPLVSLPIINATNPKVRSWFICPLHVFA